MPPPETERAVAVRAEDVVLAHDQREALRIGDLSLPAGRVTAVIGPNGSGKSTLLAAVSGLLEPVRGRLEVLGATPGPRREVAHVLQRVDADAALPLTVREVVRMGRYARRGLLRRLTAADHAAVDRALARLGISDLQHEQLATLSGGQRQRALVAQGLAQQAPLLLLDEPATGLDMPTRQRIAAVLRTEREAGRTVVLTTHDLTEATASDHVVLLAGRVVASGPPDSVLVRDRLREAYGGGLHTAGDGALILDDPHHRHGPGRGARERPRS